MSDNGLSTMEMLPNELLLDTCKHLTARELYRAFYGLNHRFRLIINSMPNLHLTMTDIECHVPIWLTFRRIIKLSIDRVKHIDLHRFPNVRSLKWISPSDVQLQQMYSFTYFPHLDQLSVHDMRDTSSTAHFHQFIFSNGFPLVRKCNLSRVDISCAWTLAPCLRAISIRSVTNPLAFARILISCPNLTRLDLQVLHNMQIPSSNTFQHFNLKKLYLTGNLPLQSVENVMACVPSLVQFNVKWTVREQPIVYFQHLSNIFNVFLPYLCRFDCDFLFSGQYDDLIRLQRTLEELVRLIPISHLVYSQKSICYI
jgi:hypothetical protein